MNHNQNDEAVYCIRFANFKPVDFFPKKRIAIEGTSKERLVRAKEIERNTTR